MIIEAPQLVMVSIRCFNRLNVKQNAGRAGQDQRT